MGLDGIPSKRQKGNKKKVVDKHGKETRRNKIEKIESSQKQQIISDKVDNVSKESASASSRTTGKNLEQENKKILPLQTPKERN